MKKQAFNVLCAVQNRRTNNKTKQDCSHSIHNHITYIIMTEQQDRENIYMYLKMNDNYNNNDRNMKATWHSYCWCYGFIFFLSSHCYFWARSESVHRRPHREKNEANITLHTEGWIYFVCAGIVTWHTTSKHWRNYIWLYVHNDK